MKIKKYVPEIRFNMYEDEWHSDILKNIGESFTGLTGKSKKDFGHGDGEYIEYSNINQNTLADLNGTAKIGIDKSQNEVQYGDVLFTTSSETFEEVGMSSVWLDNRPNVYLNSFSFGFRPTIEVDPYYMAYVLRSENVRRDIIRLGQGISRINISKIRIGKDVPIPLPSIEEQKKIGQLFKTLDNLILAQEKQVSNLEQNKKAMLQKMFPQKGETVPKIRFNRFRDEWVVKQMSEIVAERNLQLPADDEYPLMSFTSTKGVTPKTEQTDRSFLVKNNNKKYKRTKMNDLVYSSNNLDVGAIGLNKQGNASISPVYSIFYTINDFDPYLLSLIIQSKEFIHEMLRFRQGALYGQYRIHEKNFLKISILVPSIDEQLLIGKFFKNLDNQIAAQKKKVEGYKNLKQGLLQKMFV